MSVRPEYYTLSELFTNRLFRIPHYQRAYSWQQEHRTAKSYNISNTEINKIQGIELAIDLLEAIERGPDQEFRNGLLQSIS